MNEETQVKVRDLGLLLLRVGLGGIFFLLHGWGKLFAGPEKWTGLGKAMEVFGVAFLPVVWGFLAAFSECVGGLAIALGIFFRPFCALLTITMIVAAAMHLNQGHGLAQASHAIEIGIVAFTLIFIGPGALNLGRFFQRKRRP